MRRCKPRSESLRIGLLDLIIGPRLPCAIVNIVEVIDGLRFDTARGGDGAPGLDAPLHRTGIALDRTPCRRDAARDGVSFQSSATGQRRLGSTAKALRLDAFDVAMPDQEDFRQCSSLPSRVDSRNYSAQNRVGNKGAQVELFTPRSAAISMRMAPVWPCRSCSLRTVGSWW